MTIRTTTSPSGRSTGKLWTTCFLLFLLALVPVIARAQQPGVTLSASPGLAWDASSPPNLSFQHRDWLTDAFPLFITPSQTVSSVITLDPTGFPPVPTYTGRIRLDATCCGILGAPGLAFPRVTARVGPLPPQLTAPSLSSLSLPTWLSQLPGMSGASFRLSSTIVNVPGRPAQASLSLTAEPTVAVGDWRVLVRAQDPARRVDKTMEVLLSVLPAWPADGPRPTCTSGLQVLPLSSLNVYAWKASHLSSTSYSAAITFSSGTKGMEFNVRNPPAPLPFNTAIVQFKHNQGWHAGIRNENSSNCATSGPTRILEAGDTVRFVITSADTTTLVFSKPTCRAFFIFCWGKVGLDDVVEFSEGPFWALFGGHEVDIQTVGDWGDGFAFAFGQINSPN